MTSNNLSRVGNFDFAIIVPTRNRANTLTATIASLAEQRLPADRYEIIVVDNGSTDETFAAAQRIIMRHPNHRIRVLSEPIPGLLAGRHRGIKATSAEIAVFVDDDIRADAGWLSGIESAFADPEVQLVGGPNLPEFEVSPPAWLEQFKQKRPNGNWWCSQLSLFDLGSHRQAVDPTLVFGLNFAVRRNALERAGGFHPDGVPWELRRYRGDGETGLCSTFRERGFKAVYEPKALVYHMIPASRLTIEYFERRSFLQGISDSYSDIRRQALHRPAGQNGILRGLGSRIRGGVRRVRNGIRKLVHGRHDTEVDLILPNCNVMMLTKRAYRDGYRYHQQQVASDAALLRWVIQKDYWDSWLPETQLSANVGC